MRQRCLFARRRNDDLGGRAQWQPPSRIGHSRVRIEAAADREGYLTVFNVGPTGDLTLLYPSPSMAAGPAVVAANHPVVIAKVRG
jgi:hypothetical protein